MPLFENNLSPYLTIVEATEPAAPSAGQQRLYIDSTTHLLKATNSSGTDRTIEGVPAGAITTSGLTQATARLLGRTTASTGAVEEITVGTGLSLSAGSLTATGGGGGLLAALMYLPAGSNSVNVTSTTLVDVTAGAAITFTAPASGNVLVQVGAFLQHPAWTNDIQLGLRESTTIIAGPDRMILANVSSVIAKLTTAFLLTGISGGSHTYKLAACVTGGTGVIYWGTGTPASIDMSVWSAP